jgi:hypothetical protein
MKRTVAELVPDSTNGDDEFWMRVVAFELHAEPPDVNVDGARVHLFVSAPDHVNDFTTAEDPVRRPDKCTQDLKLPQTQLHLSAADHDLVGVVVDPQPANVVSASQPSPGTPVAA